MIRRAVFLCLLLTLTVSAVGQDDYRPKVAEASRDAELAIQGFVKPKGMSATLLASEPALANPVAFYVGHDGKVYVCETFRQEVGVEDNRSHMNWLNNDLRLESVEERLAMFRQYLGDDVSKYATEHDRIRVLQDTTGDGKYDSDTIFAQGFNDILDGTGAGVIEHGGKVYYTCIPKLWMLEDTDGDSKADVTEALHHGYGVRVAFRGHDMHGLTIGPDGRLYFSIGDRGFNVITKEGTRLKMVDTGAVFRCDMDGSHLEVFAYGLRNPQELAFDNYGNLWTGDNNSDSGDLARWVYVVEDGDTGWRMYYQYMDDRGPWNRERMWYPYRADDETTAVQPAFIVPPVANLGDGPSGLTYYPGLGLSPRYDNHFFMADFRGGASNSGIRSFSVKPKGATFELTDSHQFIWSILGTDVDFAADGGLYVTDWVNGWVGEGKGRLYRFTDDEHVSAVHGANVQSLLNGGVQKSGTPELLELLNHKDRRVRMSAQFELVSRDAYTEVCKAFNGSEDSMQQLHLAWACWQFGLKDDGRAFQVAEMFLQRGEIKGEIGNQKLRILSDLLSRHGRDLIAADKCSEVLVKATQSEDLRRAGFAAVALGALGDSSAAKAIFALLNRNNNEDPIVRHQAIVALAAMAERDPGRLLPVVLSGTPAEKLAMAVVMRRVKDDNVAVMLEDSDPAVVAEAARSLLAIGSRAGLQQLSSRLILPSNDPKGSSDPVVIRRALEAAYRLGTVMHANMVAEVAGDSKRDNAIRLIAADMLLTWNDPQPTDTVDGHWRELPQRKVTGLAELVSPKLPEMLAASDALRSKGIEIAAQLEIRDVRPALKTIFQDATAEEDSRVAAFKALAQLTDDNSSLLEEGQQDSSELVRIAALEFLTRSQPAAAVAALVATVKSGTLGTQQKAIALLGRIDNEDSREFLSQTMESLSAGELPDSIALDVLLAAEKSKSDPLESLVAKFRRLQAESASTMDKWSDCLNGGDVERGKTVFFGRAAASCRRCHMVNGSGAKVGPDLSEIAKEKDRAYLLESIVDPNAKIAKGFETTIIVDFDGRIHAGIIKEDNDKVVKLMSPQGAIETIAKDEIEERAKGQSGMPSDLSKNLSRSEIRDLVAYLATLKVAETTAHGAGTEE